MRIHYLNNIIKITHVGENEAFLSVASVALTKSISHGITVMFTYTGVVFIVCGDESINDMYSHYLNLINKMPITLSIPIGCIVV